MIAFSSLAMLATLIALASGPTAHARLYRDHDGRVRTPTPEPQDMVAERPRRSSPASAETLWIFDADFEDLLGDNAGWTTFDLSETMHYVNYWHKDTIHRWSQDPAHPLGDSTWWCGTYGDSCWRQPRGYGNNWICMLLRVFPETADTEPGDEIRLEYDQRYAMESAYDYGYTDISADGGQSWTTVQAVENIGFAGTPGVPQEWGSTTPAGPGHMSIDLSDYAGTDLAIRFRFESDYSYSSQDEYNNPPLNSCLDGAWQLDNIAIYVNDTLRWIDDCEDPGGNGWNISDLGPQGQTGAYFRRTFEPDTFREYGCGTPGSGWMMAAVDTLTGVMADGQYTWLIGPPIEIPDEGDFYIEWRAWYDLPLASNDHANLHPIFYDTEYEECFWVWMDYYPPGFGHGEWRAEIGPEWRTIGKFVDTDYDRMRFYVQLWNEEPAAPGAHAGGVFLDRVRVACVTGPDQPTTWSYGYPYRFRDTFSLESAQTLGGEVHLRDPDGVASVSLHASNDAGESWNAYAMEYEGTSDIDDLEWDSWDAAPPTDLIESATTIRYYFSATDDLGNVSTWPEAAPFTCFDFSVLPINGSPEDPGILLVVKGRDDVIGDDRSYSRTPETALREALDILGYEYDVFRDPRPGSYYYTGGGPTDSMAYQAYDTHVWFTSVVNEKTFRYADQNRLVEWLEASTHESRHKLLIYGNDIGHDLIELGNERAGFLTDIFEAEYVARHPGEYGGADVPDTLIRVRDAGLGLMTYDDGECWLRCACPEFEWFDVVVPSAGGGAVPALEYDNGTTTIGAGVAKVDSTYGYRVVYLPFGIEFMNDGLNGIDGHYINGVHDRVDLVANVMEFLGETPSGPGTGIADGRTFRNGLTAAHPNPFGPNTTVRYTVATESHVSLRIFDLAGRVVRTLVDREVRPGEYRIAWDGSTDAGLRAATGVYFVRMEVTGGDSPFLSARKVALLR
jgi:hypothetical protein